MVDVGAVGSIVGAPAHRRVAREVAEGSITLVKNGADLLPIDVEGRRVLVTGWSEAGVRYLASALERQGATVRRLWTGYSPSGTVIDVAADAARARGLVIVLTAYARADERQRELVRRLVGTGTPVVTVAVREPYDIAGYASRTHLATYSTTAASMGALARVITGEVEPAGRLPVTVPRAGGGTLFPFGHGLGY
jgi:beta-N-acetylhexosaminidase